MKYLVLTLEDFDLARFNILSLCLPGVDHVLTLGAFDLMRFNILSLCLPGVDHILSLGALI